VKVKTRVFPDFGCSATEVPLYSMLNMNWRHSWSQMDPSSTCGDEVLYDQELSLFIVLVYDHRYNKRLLVLEKTRPSTFFYLINAC
jgi:hypothetical protein